MIKNKFSVTKESDGTVKIEYRCGENTIVLYADKVYSKKDEKGL